jgi:hypothetical protein
MNGCKDSPNLISTFKYLFENVILICYYVRKHLNFAIFSNPTLNSENIITLQNK